jgi:general L-amino acid transport system permease protein
MTEISGSQPLPPEVVEALAADKARPEEHQLPPGEWVKENLFSSFFNGLLTIFFAAFGFVVVRGLLSFIFNPATRWDGTATNLRFLMTGAYPSEQYIRVWVSLGIIFALAGLTAAVWKAGSQVSLVSVARRGIIVGVGIFVVGTLGGDFYLPWFNSDGYVTMEGRFSTSALVQFLVAGLVLAAVSFVVMLTVDKDRSVSSLLIFITGIGLAVGSLWVVPYGHHAFLEDEGTFIAESGTVAATTKGPWTVMVVVLIVAYFVGKAAAGAFGERLRTVMIALWLASPLVIVFFVLRDPDFDYDHILRHELLLFNAHAIIGGALLYWLTKPGLGEIGRIVAGLVLLVALATVLRPMQQVIRITAAELALFALAASSFAGAAAARRRYVTAWIVTVGLTIWLVTAINSPSTVEVSASFFIGGLALTLMVAVFTLILSFPLGVLLALARTSKLPIFRVMSTLYIEFVRGVPFITILIFFSVMLPLFLPENMEVSEIAAVTIGFVLFSAAYLAENVRGGLQSVRVGQYEAADAVGMNTVQRTLFIVLPQALRVSIPPLVGQAIATYKETSLLSIIGLFDLLFIARSLVPAQLEFLGSTQEQLLFASAIYWVGAYSMSRASQRLERRVGLGEQ